MSLGSLTLLTANDGARGGGGGNNTDLAICFQCNLVIKISNEGGGGGGVDESLYVPISTKGFRHAHHETKNRPTSLGCHGSSYGVCVCVCTINIPISTKGSATPTTRSKTGLPV